MLMPATTYMQALADTFEGLTMHEHCRAQGQWLTLNASCDHAAAGSAAGKGTPPGNVTWQARAVA